MQIDKLNTWLSDIKQAINEINSFIPDKKDFFEFQKDIKTKRAIERNIEIIGEAMNRIIHGYDSVSEEIIWAIVLKDIPMLEKEVDKQLS